MIPKKKYILGDFTKYATGRLATHFTDISDMALYQFSEKLYLDDKHNTHRRHMFLVGHYSRKAGGPPVWACATGEKICYYSGPGKQVTPLVQDIHSSKVYYDPPSSYIGGSHDYSSQRPGMNPERKLERAVVDSAINFIFLLSGRLEQVFDLVNPHILGHFKLACTNLVRHDEPHTGNASYEQTSESTVSASPANGRLHSHEPIAFAEPTLQLAHRSKSTASPILGKRQFVDLSDDRTGDLPCASNKRTRLFQQISDYETEIHAKYEREIRELTAQLEQQQAKTGDAKERLMREKTKRRLAQVERETWREKYIEQQRLAQSAAKSVKEEEESEDWKAMLFDQEKKTEHYKLKYIALKEEKKVWQAQTAQEGRNNTEPEHLHTSQETDLVQEREAAAEQQGERVQRNRNTKRNMFGDKQKTKPTSYRPLQKSLSRFWEAYKIPGVPNPPRRIEILQDLDNMYRKLYKLEYEKAIDVTRDKVRVRLYTKAVRHMEQILIKESYGIQIKGRAAVVG